MSSENVLKKLLKRPVTAAEIAVEEFLRPGPVIKQKKKRPGRPEVDPKKKARNFTLCLSPQYLEFLDKMVVKDPKIKGRGRKIRFIIDRFIEHEKRSLGQLKVLRESLNQVQVRLKEFGGRVQKGERLELSAKEKGRISEAVDQVHLLLKILHYSPKTLQRLLPREEWAILSFCLNWKSNNGVKL